MIHRFSVDTVVLPDVSCLPEADLIEPLNELFSRASRGEQKIRRVAAGDELSMGEAKFEILNPPFPGYSDAKLNDTSIVMKMTLWETTVLFTGDIGEKVEFRLIEEYGERLHCDFLKISHHGIVYQNHLRFFQAVSPRLAVAQNLRPEGVFMRVLRQVLEEHHGLPEENFFFTGRDGRLRAAIGKNGIEFYRQFD